MLRTDGRKSREIFIDFLQCVFECNAIGHQRQQLSLCCVCFRSPDGKKPFTLILALNDADNQCEATN